MHFIRSVVLLGACLAATASVAAAVPPQAQPAGRTPEITYRSAFADYRPFREEPISNWRALNDEVGETGGHAGIMRGTNEAAGEQRPATPSGKPVKSAPAPDAHRH
jgi:hypothetical protein